MLSFKSFVQALSPEQRLDLQKELNAVMPKALGPKKPVPYWELDELSNDELLKLKETDQTNSVRIEAILDYRMKKGLSMRKINEESGEVHQIWTTKGESIRKDGPVLVVSFLFGDPKLETWFIEDSPYPNRPEEQGPAFTEWHLDNEGDEMKKEIRYSGILGPSRNYAPAIIRLSPLGEVICEEYWLDGIFIKKDEY